MDKKNLDKIVEFLLDDTEIHYEYQSLQIIGSDIEYDIDILYLDFFDMMQDKLEFDYGLNSDDRLYVYGNYLYQINKKMKDYGYINESVDNKERYLDKIVDYMVEDTTITPKEILFPFMAKPYLRSPYGKPENFPFHFFYEVFTQYCSDNYGLTENESYSVWEKYKTILIGNKLINESINSRGDYLNKVIEYMVDDSEIDFYYKAVNLLFLDPPMLLFFFMPVVPPEILDYCKYVYGLNDVETIYVWRKYKNIIVDNFDRKKHQ